MYSGRNGELIDYTTAHDDRARMAEYLQSTGVRQIGNEAETSHRIRQNRIVFSVIALLLLGTGLFFVIF